MKSVTICFLLVVGINTGICQVLPDSVFTKYNSAKTGEEKGSCISDYLTSESFNDSVGTQKALELASWFKKQSDEVGADYTSVILSQILATKGDFPAALNLSFSSLSHFEARGDDFGISTSYQNIAAIYFQAKDFEQAGIYFKKVIALTSPSDNEKLSSLYNAVGCVYGEAGMPDSGMVYAQKAVNMDTEMKDFNRLALSTSTLAENYIAAKEYEIALPFLRKSADYYKTKQASTGTYLHSYLLNDFAQVFLAIQKYDSAQYYAQEALQFSIPGAHNDQSMRSYEYLYKTFEQTNHQDSVNKYFRMAMTLKDSIFNIEKTRNIQALSFREELRQQEMASAKVTSEEERKKNIQFASIALAIVSFIVIYLALSRSFITNTKIIEFFGVMALLIVFEFLNLLLHPFLEKVTNHSPVLMLFALVCLAALLIPLHHRLEKWTTSKLVEKNKEIRLAIAKKTIEKLEEKQ